jgi:hypothetical protein
LGFAKAINDHLYFTCITRQFTQLPRSQYENCSAKLGCEDWVQVAIADDRVPAAIVEVEGLSTIALTEFDTYNRFRALAARGDRVRGLALLDQLDERSAPSRVMNFDQCFLAKFST